MLFDLLGGDIVATIRSIAIVSLAALALPCSTAAVPDEGREGPFLELGVGPGLNSYSQQQEAFGVVQFERDRVSEASLATNAKLGVGMTDHLLLYGVSRMGWHAYDPGFEERVTVADGVTGLGLSYYTYPLPPSVYLMLAGGVASWATPFESDGDTWLGPGFLAGFGYEWSELWSIEGTGMWGKPGESSGAIETDTDALALLFTLNASVR